MDSSGAEVAALVEECGLVLLPWQRHVLDVAMRERQDGRWAAPEVALVVPRQNGKGDVLLAREVAGLFLLDEDLIVHTAHEMATAKDAHRRLKAVLRKSPELWARTGYRDANGDLWVWNTETGGRVRFMTRTEDAGRGLTAADLMIYDEAYALTAEQRAALDYLTTVKRNAQSWFTSSSGMPDSEQLLSIRDRGRSGDRFLAFLEWSRDPSLSFDDRQGWAQANPSLGYLFDEERVEREFSGATTSDALRIFGRERLGDWPENAKVEWPVDPDVWYRSADPSSRIAGRKCFAVDIPWSRERSVIAVAGARGDGLEHVEVVEQLAGTAWVVDRMVGLVERWGPGLPVALDAAGPAGALVADLEAAGLEVFKVSGRELAAACGGFRDRVMEDRVRHLGDPVLTSALDGTRKRMTGDAGAYVWDRRSPAVDISPLVAVTVALHSYAVNGRVEDPEPWAFFE